MLAAAGFATKLYLSRGEPAPRPTAAPAPVSPILVPLAAPQLVVVPAPGPAVPLPPEEPVIPEPRALAPVVRPECVAETNPIENQPHCQWDDGFPAISADGSTIATAFVPIDDGRGHPGLTIRLVDAASSKVVKSVLVLSPDEYVERDDPRRGALEKKIARRAVQAQAMIRGYRSLIELGERDSENVERTELGLHADFADDAVRVIDTVNNLAIWQRRFDLAEEFPNRKLDGDHCEPISANAIRAAWDPVTRTIVASVNYLTGPEFCGNDVQRDYIARVKP